MMKELTKTATTPPLKLSDDETEKVVVKGLIPIEPSSSSSGMPIVFVDSEDLRIRDLERRLEHLESVDGVRVVIDGAKSKSTSASLVSSELNVIIPPQAVQSSSTTTCKSVSTSAPTI